MKVLRIGINKMKINENEIIEDALNRYEKQISDMENIIKNFRHTLLVIKNYLENEGDLQKKVDNIIQMFSEIESKGFKNWNK